MYGPILQIEDLCVAYQTAQGRFLALDRVSLTINRGEIVGLVGETGSGKSTLASAVLGTLPRHQPMVIDGRVLFGANSNQAGGRKVTWVPQNTYASLNPLFRIGTQMVDQMRYSAPRTVRRRLWRPYRKEILDMLEAVQLKDARRILSQYPHQLSGGQRQRVILAMALLPNPELIIADEPTSALDATTQIEILKLLRWIASSQRISILFATHNLAAAWEVCDRIMVMHDGRIIESARRETFFTQPRHPYTRALLGSALQPLMTAASIRTDAMGRERENKGCQFSQRCSHAMASCFTARPSLEPDSSSHQVACHNPSTNQTPFAYNQA